MATFAQKQNQPEKRVSSSRAPSLTPAPGPDLYEHILYLQRTAGNQAVQQLLQEPAADREARLAGTAAPRPGRNVSPPPPLAPATGSIQPQLAINQPGDIHEQEAERIADQVVGMPEPQPQRVCACGGGCLTCRAEQPGREHEDVQTKSVQTSDTGQIAASPIVHEVLRSPGETIDPATRAFMEQRFGHDFGRIRIHTDAHAAKVAEALGADAFTSDVHIAFAHARFLPGTADGKRLVAHELTHAIQQARLPRLRSPESDPAVNHSANRLAHTVLSIGTAPSPHLALRPTKTGVSTKSGGSVIEGKLLGWNQYDESVQVKREVGATQGYDDRLQAIAVARLGKAEPAAVVQGKDRKWHAVETTAHFEAGLVSTDPYALETTAGGDTAFLAIHGLPSLTGIDFWRQRVDSLKAELVEIDSRKTTSAADSKAAQEERDRVRRDLGQANETRVKFILGVPESEIQFNVHSSGRKAGKINITGQPGQGSTGAALGPVIGQGGVDFTPTMITAFEIDFPEFEKPPARAQSALFHEVQHLKDYQFAQEWVKNYETESGRIFVAGSPGRMPLENWLNAQVPKKRLTKADVELIVDETQDLTATTEARANVRTFLAILQTGDPDQAIKEIVAYANALKPGRQYANPATGSYVEAALTRELHTAYRQMPKEMQRQFKAALAAAKKANPSAWISHIDFSK